MKIRIQHLPIRLDRNIRRVLSLPFDVSDPVRIGQIFDSVATLNDEDVTQALTNVRESFSLRHRKIEEHLEEHYETAARLAKREPEASPERRLLLGAYFSMEYSIEAAALFNPSIVAHPDQTGVPDGGLRFIMSLRAVGEGHLSSTVFQTGMLLPSGAMALDPQGNFSVRTRIRPDRAYHRDLFFRKLKEMSVNSQIAEPILARLPARFTIDALQEVVTAVRAEHEDGVQHQFDETINNMLWLARANYKLQLAPEDAVGDLILFPRTDSEKRGIEDLRMVRFTEEDGAPNYFGTYTAFNGERILPMLLETSDFREIYVHTLNGNCAQNKGMALFPRRIGGHYAMCSRIDGRNLFLMMSDMVHFWETAKLLAEPRFDWELRLIGNCGSPLETPEGWLLLTHGVGPMRRYCIGAMLLDLEDPFKIRGRLREPLLAPSEEEREGYVPNVVYTCGALIHRDKLILPYAVSDTATRMATIRLDELLDRLLKDGN